MISEAHKIEAFVDAVKGKELWEVLALAVEEADWADRRVNRNHRAARHVMQGTRQYSRQLKKLIDYLRYEVEPRRPSSKVYQLYRTHFRNAAQSSSMMLAR